MKTGKCEKCSRFDKLRVMNNKKVCRICYSEKILKDFLYNNENSHGDCFILENMTYYDVYQNGFLLSNKISTASKLNLIVMQIENGLCDLKTEMQEKIIDIYHDLFSELAGDFKKIINNKMN